MRKNIVVMILTTFLALMPGPSKAFASMNVSSPIAILMDAETGQVLYKKNHNQATYPASITKIMTAILALEKGDLKDFIPVSKKASFIDGSKIYLLEGEKVTLEQLLYGLLLESGNDAAIAIAEYIAGSVEEFAIMMNDRATQLGALNTNFVNPNGLPDTQHVTSAYDIALIARHAMTLPKFRNIVNTTRYIIPETNMQDTRYLYNGNRLIKNTSHKYEGANGIKTGYTLAAKHCFVGSAQRDGREFITVIMGEQNSNALWDNTINLLDYAFDNFQQLQVIEKGKLIDKVESRGTGSDVRIIAEQGFHYDYAIGEEAPHIEDTIVMENIKPTVPNGERVGYIEYRIDEEIIGKIRLIARRDHEDKVVASGILKNASNSSKYGLFKLLLILPVSVLAFRFIVKSRKRRRFTYIRKRSLFRRK